MSGDIISLKVAASVGISNMALLQLLRFAQFADSEWDALTA